MQQLWHQRQYEGGFVHQWQGRKGFREASIEIRSDWPVVEELSKNQLEKANPLQAGLKATE